MASPNSSLTDLVVTTLDKYNRKIADNVTNDNALLRRLNENGSIREQVGGGATFVEPLIYGTNDSAQFFTGYDTFTPPTTGQEVITGAQYQPKQLGGFISISGLEEDQNAGEERRFELVEARMMQLEAVLNNIFSTSQYSTGTGSGGRELGGLQLLIADNPAAAGTIGGIPQVPNVFWRNQFSAAAATTSANVQSRMNSMWLATKRGRDVVDLILCDNDFYTYYWESLNAIQRITSQESGEAVRANLKYNKADVEYDDQCPDKHMYFVQTKFLKCKHYPGKWFKNGKARQIANADYNVIPVFTTANFTCSNRARQGVIIAS